MESGQHPNKMSSASNDSSGNGSDSSGSNNEVEGIGSGSSTQESSGETSVVISTTTRTLADGTRSVTTVTSSKSCVGGRLQCVTKTVTKHLPSLPVVTKEYTTLKDGAVEVRTVTTVVYPGGRRETIVKTHRQPSAAAQDDATMISAVTLESCLHPTSNPDHVASGLNDSTAKMPTAVPSAVPSAVPTTIPPIIPATSVLGHENVLPTNAENIIPAAVPTIPEEYSESDSLEPSPTSQEDETAPISPPATAALENELDPVTQVTRTVTNKVEDMPNGQQRLVSTTTSDFGNGHLSTFTSYVNLPGGGKTGATKVKRPQIANSSTEEQDLPITIQFHDENIPFEITTQKPWYKRKKTIYGISVFLSFLLTAIIIGAILGARNDGKKSSQTLDQGYDGTGVVADEAPVFSPPTMSPLDDPSQTKEDRDDVTPDLPALHQGCNITTDFEISLTLNSSEFFESKVGQRVAIEGNYAVMGAYNYISADGFRVGAAFAFSFNDEEQWLQSGAFTPNTNRNDVNFGWDVAISGDTIVIGSKDENGYQNSDEKWIGRGYAYVYVLNSSGGWTQQALLIPYSASPDAEFGVSVDIDRDTIVVGAWGDRNRRGSAFIFRRSGTNWVEKQKLVPDSSTAARGTINGDEKGNFGRCVAIHENGRYIAVKSPNDTAEGETTVGAVYIYEESNLDTWSEKQKLSTPEGIDTHFYGKDIDFGDGYLVVGAPGRESAYIFVLRPSSFASFENDDFIFERKQQISASDGKTSDLFGISVNADSANIIVGASGNDRAYIFRKESDGEWREKRIIGPQQTTSQNQNFGLGVAISGHKMMVGAPERFSDGKGRAEIFNFICST